MRSLKLRRIGATTSRNKENVIPSEVGVDWVCQRAGFEPFSELGHTWRVLAVGPELVNRGLVLRDIAIDLVSILEIEHDHLVHERELQGGKLTEEHFGLSRNWIDG
jgi:hypothetical protein